MKRRKCVGLLWAVTVALVMVSEVQYYYTTLLLLADRVYEDFWYEEVE